MQIIKTPIKEILTKSLFEYYKDLSRGDLQAQSHLMTDESYVITLKVLGFKRAHKNREFKKLLKGIGDSKAALRTVEAVLSSDLANEANEHEIALVSFESKGPNRITLNYSEDAHPKKLCFSSSHGKWKIDFEANRRTA